MGEKNLVTVTHVWWVHDVFPGFSDVFLFQKKKTFDQNKNKQFFFLRRKKIPGLENYIHVIILFHFFVDFCLKRVPTGNWKRC